MRDLLSKGVQRRQALLWAAASMLGCAPSQFQEKLPVRLGIALQPGAVLPLLAREQGFFEQAGLLPSYQTYPSGKRALHEGLLADQVDVVNTADLPVVQAVLQRQEVSILAQLQSVRSVNSIVARPDRGIKSVADLAGKRVATQRDSAVHFFLDRALRFYGLAPEAVVQVYQPIERLVDTLLAGEVDAVAVREPYVAQAQARMGGRAVAMEVPWAYLQYELLVTRRAFSQAQPQVLQRILLALFMAETYFMDAPEAAQRQLARSLGVPLAAIERLLQQSSQRVRLGDDLMGALLEQARWLEPASRLDVSAPLQEAIDHQPMLAVQKLRLGSLAPN